MASNRLNPEKPFAEPNIRPATVGVDVPKTGLQNWEQTITAESRLHPSWRNAAASGPGQNPDE